jgi:predicted ArsR family transcriptional regulator
MKRENGSYNKTKKRALEVLEDITWMDVPAFAHKVGIRPVRRTYTHLAHLENLGLVTRGLDAPGKLHFQITDRGLERLQWLRLQSSAKTTLEDMIVPFLRSK